MSESNSQSGIFINGKQQIIEMLQFMNEDERKTLLTNIRHRNAVMARELSEQSLSFVDLFALDRTITKRVLQHVNPTIVGLALYLAPMKYQRLALSLMERDDAETAFHIMNQNLSGKKSECKKAQDKILQTAITMSKRKLIEL